MYRVVIVDIAQGLGILSTVVEDDLKAAMGLAHYWNGVEDTRAYVYADHLTTAISA